VLLLPTFHPSGAMAERERGDYICFHDTATHVQSYSLKCAKVSIFKNVSTTNGQYNAGEFI